jgi:hypothetical protein
MVPKHVLLGVGGLLIMTALAGSVPLAHAGNPVRIVWPYGVDERWVPVVAGYEVVPPPTYCDFARASGSNVLFQDSFESGTLAPFAAVPTVVPFGDVSHLQSFWHVTTYHGVGTDFLHQGAGKLYYGRDAQGDYNSGFRNAGTLAVPVALPAGTTQWYLGFHTKWETENLDGYDHMWVEAQPADGRVYILCTLNPLDRPDSTSADYESASCSPYHAVVCVSDTRGFSSTIVSPSVGPVAQVVGIAGKTVDSTAPHWEARSVAIPSLWNGQTVSLRLTWDSSDPVANSYLGWMVDDVVVSDGEAPSMTLPGGTVVG